MDEVQLPLHKSATILDGAGVRGAAGSGAGGHAIRRKDARRHAGLLPGAAKRVP